MVFLSWNYFLKLFKICDYSLGDQKEGLIFIKAFLPQCFEQFPPRLSSDEIVNDW